MWLSAEQQRSSQYLANGDRKIFLTPLALWLEGLACLWTLLSPLCWPLTNHPLLGVSCVQGPNAPSSTHHVDAVAFKLKHYNSLSNIRTTLCKFKMNLVKSGGPISTLPYLQFRYSSILWFPVFSCLICGPKAEAPKFRLTTSQSDISLTVAGRQGWGVSVLIQRKIQNCWDTLNRDNDLGMKT